MLTYYCVGGAVVIVFIIILVWIFFLNPRRLPYPPPYPIPPLEPSEIIAEPTNSISRKLTGFDNCRNCGKKIPGDSDICPFCEMKYPFKPQNSPDENNKL